MNTQKRIEIEKKVVRKLIRMAKKIGFDTVSVYDGGEWYRNISESKALEHVFSVDESHIHFSHENGESFRVFIVLGNDGYDAICDHSYSLKEDHPWNAMIESIFTWCEKFCP